MNFVVCGAVVVGRGASLTAVWIWVESEMKGSSMGFSSLGSQMNDLAHCRLGFESNISWKGI